MIPFLGLIIPNIVTIYQGDHLKKSLAHTAVLGAVFVLICDIIGRVIIYTYEFTFSLTVGFFCCWIFVYLQFCCKKFEIEIKSVNPYSINTILLSSIQY